MILKIKQWLQHGKLQFRIITNSGCVELVQRLSDGQHFEKMDFIHWNSKDYIITRFMQNCIQVEIVELGDRYKFLDEEIGRERAERHYININDAQVCNLSYLIKYDK